MSENSIDFIDADGGEWTQALKYVLLRQQRDTLATALREIVRRKKLLDDGDDALTYLCGAIQDAEAALKRVEES